MRPAQRWPLHPAPASGEALSSWLHRVAACYQMTTSDLLAYDLSHDHVDGLDIEPPESLLTALSYRSGIEMDRLRGMSIAGWMPGLLDSLDDQDSSAFETYVCQLSVLLPGQSRRRRSVKPWRAWLPPRTPRRACPVCMRNAVDAPLLLMWQLPLLLSCPSHGCWLEPYAESHGQFLGWENDPCEPREADEAITAMDRRTWQALTTGYVALPRRHVHAGLWFRLLRTLLDELNTPISLCGANRSTIRGIWARCDLPVRAGRTQWRPFEVLAPDVQLQMLEAAAVAIWLLESKSLRPGGDLADLFLPVPYIELDNGLQTYAGQSNQLSSWQKMVRAIEGAAIEARHNRETARMLFRLAANGRNDLAYLEELRARFVQDQIPPEFLADYVPERVFGGDDVS